MSHFFDKLRIKIDKKTDMVTLSIRITDEKVELHQIRRSDFDVMIAQYNSQKEK